MKELDVDALDLSAFIRPGDTIAWGQGPAEPLLLTRALAAQRRDLGRVRVFLGASSSDTFRPEHADHIDFLSYCGAGANRALARARRLDILPCHYSQLPEMIARGLLKIDVLLLQVAPADEDGRYSLGLAHEYLLPALEHARVVLAEVNECCPWTYGERALDAMRLAGVVRSSRPLPETPEGTFGETERRIGSYICGLVEDGATLQLGLGSIPEAVLRALGEHRDLGIHSGVIGDGVAALMTRGVITNLRKSVDTGLTVAGLAMGSGKLFGFLHRNPSVSFRSTAYTHHPEVLARIDRFVAINSAVEVDLTGQVNAEIASNVYVGGVGGAVDFLRGAARSRGGLPIVALPSRAGAVSRIVARLAGPVSTARSDIGILVTEHGIADLRGLSLAARRSRMLALADPDFRDSLEKDAWAHEERGGMSGEAAAASNQAQTV